MEKTVDELMAEATAGNTERRRKLTFRQQCGAFAALYGGQSNYVVAEAFGVSLTTISHLSGCLEYDPDPYRFEVDPKTDLVRDEKVLRDHNRNRSPNRRRHYEDVAREFDALGVQRFNDRYYRPVHERIMLAKARLDAARLGKPHAPLDSPKKLENKSPT